ncbi:hypothetical protein P152DRAFT_398415 [Eremomyces bilateralis CBS 781.70]|uniref:Uncharacterized protein n=1 Tax=Eremomyces bilateralis CBS 781.70 TaxID=1392243 RepID=A0A6G1G1I0_9PEZI|nr:uncharacterized protein P152DRAFT_398415 [Eremomyces bilateralis CBS 781.70]KAF1811780.1 hypothetical protein P152DRAFT_398415 [Eremomyces bilateralis CBS 781.70]
MRLVFAAVLSSAVAAIASSAATWGDVHTYPRHAGQRSRVRSDVLKYFNSLAKRQTSEDVLQPPPSQGGSAADFDMDKWNQETKPVCTNAVGALDGQASNSAGMAVCYNVPFLDQATGVFQAELRIFNVSVPVNEWVGVSAADISVALRYLGATVQSTMGMRQIKGKRQAEREDVIFLDALGNAVNLRSRQVTSDGGSVGSELKVLTYVGMINRNLMGPAMTLPELQPLLVPEITLMATNPVTQAVVNTTLSSTEAGFVSGVFANQGASTIDPAAQASASALAATATPFILPGVTLGIFPTGLIITLVWTAAFLAAVGFGTIKRVQFRDQYRRRMKRELGATVKRI